MRDGEDLTPDIPHVQVHLPFLVAEDPQTSDLLGEPTGLRLAVPKGDTNEEQQTLPYLGDPLTSDSYGGVLYPLEDYPHSS